MPVPDEERPELGRQRPSLRYLQWKDALYDFNRLRWHSALAGAGALPIAAKCSKISTVVYLRLQGFALRLKRRTDPQYGFAADLRHIILHAPIGTFDRCGATKTRRIDLVDRFDAGTVEAGSEDNRPDDAWKVRSSVMSVVSGPVRFTAIETKRIVGYFVASNPSALFNSPSRMLLVVDTEAVGMLISSLLAVTFFGSMRRLPLTPEKPPYQLVNPIRDTLNCTRVSIGLTA